MHRLGAPEWWDDKGHGMPGKEDWNPTPLQRLWHNFMGCNGGIISDYDDDGNLWIAFQCWECGKISGAHIAPDWLDPNP